MDVHLVRDKDTGKSKGFGFLAYEDQRSTVLAVDNLSGAKVANRIIRVEHVMDYKKKRQEMGDEMSESEYETDTEDEREKGKEAGGTSTQGLSIYIIAHSVLLKSKLPPPSGRDIGVNFVHTNEHSHFRFHAHTHRS